MQSDRTVPITVAQIPAAHRAPQAFGEARRQHALRVAPLRQEQPGSVTLSIGVAAGGSEDSLETLLGRADAALYAAKRAGRNRVSVDADEPLAAAAIR